MGKSPDLLFGAIAVSAGCLTREQLDKLLEEQSKSPYLVTIGELSVKHGLLTPNQIRRILEVQRFTHLEEVDKSLGALAVQSGFASESDIELALRAQKQMDAPESQPAARLGEILLAMGTLSLQKLKALLALQARLKNGNEISPSGSDMDTREILVSSATAQGPPSAAEPIGWLVQESPDGTGETFPVGEAAVIGRLPAHEIPVPDLGASRYHARIEFSAARRQHLLKDLDSRNGTFVNGEKITELRVLKAGDRIRIGETVMRYAAGRIPEGSDQPLPPPCPATSDAIAPAASAAIAEREPLSEEPRPDAPGVFARIGKELRRAATGAGGIASTLHVQRQCIAAAVLPGLMATFLPWKHVSGAGSILGARGPGWVTFVLFGTTFALTLLQERSRPLPKRLWLGPLALAAAAVLFGIIMLIVLGADRAARAGIGLYLTILSGAATLAATWLCREREPLPEGQPPAVDSPPGPDGSEPSPTLTGFGARLKRKVSRAGTTLRRLFGDVTGQKAKAKATTSEKRDDFLRQIGEAALHARIDGPEANSTAKARENLESSQKRLEQLEGRGGGTEAEQTAAANERVRARSAVKEAESRLERALKKLGRHVIDQGIELAGAEPRIAEVRALDAKIKDLA